MKYSISVALIIFLSLCGLKAYAQTADEVDPIEMNVTLSPENPGPNQKVQVNVISYGTDLNAANITWKVNGQTKLTGMGATSFSFTTGDLGSATKLDIYAKIKEGRTIQSNITISPASVDLIWQSESFTPPFYKGKAMYSHENKVTFIALPHIVSGGAEVNPKNLVYEWKSNGSIIEDASGYGKNTYTVVGSLISRPLDVEVNVSSATSNATAYGKVYLAPSDPSLILYRKDPLYGIQFQNALTGTMQLKNPEVAVIAMPYFFGTFNPTSSGLSYKWAINNTTVQDDLSRRIQVFRKKEGSTGQSNISLSIENSKKILQIAHTSFNLIFGESENNQASL